MPGTGAKPRLRQKASSGTWSAGRRGWSAGRTTPQNAAQSKRPSERACASRSRKKADADPVAAILRQQHQLAEIEHPGHVEAVRRESVGQGRRLVGERQPGRGTDHHLAVEGADDDAVLGLSISLEIALLVVERAVVEIGKRAEDGDAQPGQVRQQCLQALAGEPLDPDLAQASAPTWRLQSARL